MVNVTSAYESQEFFVIVHLKTLSPYCKPRIVVSYTVALSKTPGLLVVVQSPDTVPVKVEGSVPLRVELFEHKFGLSVPASTFTTLLKIVTWSIEAQVPFDIVHVNVLASVTKPVTVTVGEIVGSPAAAPVHNPVSPACGVLATIVVAVAQIFWSAPAFAGVVESFV